MTPRRIDHSLTIHCNRQLTLQEHPLLLRRKTWEKFLNKTTYTMKYSTKLTIVWWWERPVNQVNLWNCNLKALVVWVSLASTADTSPLVQLKAVKIFLWSERPVAQISPVKSLTQLKPPCKPGVRPKWPLCNKTQLWARPEASQLKALASRNVLRLSLSRREAALRTIWSANCKDKST